MVNVISLFPSLVATLELVVLFEDIDTFDMKIDGPVEVDEGKTVTTPVSYTYNPSTFSFASFV